MLQCYYISTTTGDSLLDHHERDNELLLFASPTTDRDVLVDELYHVAMEYGRDVIPEAYDDVTIRDTIYRMVQGLRDEDIYTHHATQPRHTGYEDDIYCFTTVYVYCYLVWD